MKTYRSTSYGSDCASLDDSNNTTEDANLIATSSNWRSVVAKVMGKGQDKLQSLMKGDLSDFRETLKNMNQPHPLCTTAQSASSPAPAACQVIKPFIILDVQPFVHVRAWHSCLDLTPRLRIYLSACPSPDCVCSSHPGFDYIFCLQISGLRFAPFRLVIGTVITCAWPLIRLSDPILGFALQTTFITALLPFPDALKPVPVTSPSRALSDGSHLTHLCRFIPSSWELDPWPLPKALRTS